MIVFLDGNYLPEEKASIPVSDRGFLFGDGLFTTLLVKAGKVHLFHPHLEGLQQQCHALKITPPQITELMVERLIAENNATEGTWRLKIVLTGGNNPELMLPQRACGHLLMTLKPYTPPTAPLKLAIFPHSCATSQAHLKSLSFLERLVIMDYAHQNRCDDAITMTQDKILLETAFGNIFWIYNKVLYTPEPTLPLYFGMTLTHYIENSSLPVCYGRWRLEEIPDGALVFRTNSLSLVQPIVQIGKRNFLLEKK